MTERSAHKTNRLEVWGRNLLNKLSALSRNRRKREASKKRRAAIEREDRGAGR